MDPPPSVNKVYAMILSVKKQREVTVIFQLLCWQKDYIPKEKPPITRRSCTKRRKEIGEMIDTVIFAEMMDIQGRHILN